jgi:hypothetical protein
MNTSTVSAAMGVFVSSGVAVGSTLRVGLLDSTALMMGNAGVTANIIIQFFTRTVLIKNSASNRLEKRLHLIRKKYAVINLRVNARTVRGATSSMSQRPFSRTVSL